ncbi:hypothetical protein SEA_GODONK_191 [Gordonia phage GodonK]|uniref:Uncharacterized protein n=1 Tax=Gordonia phage GodonK TaxID=2562192 RepID=A0A4D6E284_9CAUD|nr:hypothetical protein HOV33_gp177 [Gordonia phage GodonK]QBZ72779.1 hypothetical protein SEA_GODONK_191 [Gordonia phage GodonK]
MEQIIRRNHKVQGRCINCDQETLVLDPDGIILCGNKETCDKPKATHELLNAPQVHHWVKLTPYGYAIVHPLIERHKNELFNCELDKHISSLTVAPQRPGYYTVVKTEDGWDWRGDK